MAELKPWIHSELRGVTKDFPKFKQDKIYRETENILEMYNLGSLILHQLIHIASNNLT